MSRNSVSAILAIALVGACSDSAPGSDSGPDTDAATACEAAGPVPITLTTDDGLDLVADLYTSATIGQPGVILLHMIPPGNDRSNYGAEFIEPLLASGFQVLNINRRGASPSDGSATDAYQGPNGKLDAKAAYDYLTSHVCAVPPTAIAIVGASNGTTTMLDFAVYAAGDIEVEGPVALTFLSGGTYTENQHDVSDVLEDIGNTPAYFAYPPSEASWNDDVETIAGPSWQFVEYAPGAHVTNLFSANPEIIDDVVAFLVDAL